MDLILGYILVLIIMGFVTYFVYKKDKKYAAKGKWRIKESTLLLFTFLFGSLGAAHGLWKLRHKNKHWYFVVVTVVSLIIHLGILVFLIVNTLKK